MKKESWINFYDVTMWLCDQFNVLFGFFFANKFWGNWRISMCAVTKENKLRKSLICAINNLISAKQLIIYSCRFIKNFELNLKINKKKNKKNGIWSTLKAELSTINWPNAKLVCSHLKCFSCWFCYFLIIYWKLLLLSYGTGWEIYLLNYFAKAIVVA